jgi:ATP-dependent Zn protease
MDQKRLKIAYHETGHAVMALICRQRIQKVSLRGMDSQTGGDKFLAFMKLEEANPATKVTGEKAIQKIMISLGGYASEILFYDGVAGISGDSGSDLTIAAKTAENILQVPEFKSWVAGLPPAPSDLNMIENPLVRAYIHFKMGDCIQALTPLMPVIQKIAEELHNREELTGEEVSALFKSFGFL